MEAMRRKKSGFGLVMFFKFMYTEYIFMFFLQHGRKNTFPCVVMPRGHGWDAGFGSALWAGGCMDYLSILDFMVNFIFNALVALVIGVASAVLGNFIPRGPLDCERIPFRPFRWERDGAAYDLFQIEKWKDKLPDISVYVKSVFPKHVEPNLARKRTYYARFAKETCVSEIVHVALILVSPVYLLVNWNEAWGIAAMVIDIVVNIPFIMVQRYNRPRLMRIARRVRLQNEGKIDMTGDNTKKGDIHSYANHTL